MRNLKKLTILVLAMSLVLSGCSIAQSDSKDETVEKETIVESGFEDTSSDTELEEDSADEGEAETETEESEEPQATPAPTVVPQTAPTAVPTATPAPAPTQKPSHKHKYTSSVTTQPDCDTNGVKTFTCSCGKSYTEAIAATGHAWDNGVENLAATCAAEGEMLYTCTVADCGATKTEAIAKTAHTPEESTGECVACGNYFISTAAQLQTFANEVNGKSNKYTGKVIDITADIDIAGISWTPIKAWDGILNGTVINGNDNSIKNMSVTVPDGKAYGFIGNNASSITVKNLVFENAGVYSVSGDGVYAGVVMGKNYSNVTIENVKVKNSQVRCSWQAGGLVGFAEGNGPKFVNCFIENSFVGGYNCTSGALFGLGDVDITAQNCTVKNVDLYTDMEAGLVGYLYGKTLTDSGCTIENLNVVSEYPAN